MHGVQAVVGMVAEVGVVGELVHELHLRLQGREARLVVVRVGEAVASASRESPLLGLVLLLVAHLGSLQQLVETHLRGILLASPVLVVVVVHLLSLRMRMRVSRLVVRSWVHILVKLVLIILLVLAGIGWRLVVVVQQVEAVLLRVHDFRVLLRQLDNGGRVFQSGRRHVNVFVVAAVVQTHNVFAIAIAVVIAAVVIAVVVVIADDARFR